jgi:hypothetical protein
VSVAAGTVRAASVTITAINRTTKTLTFGTAVTATTATDGMTKPGRVEQRDRRPPEHHGTGRTLHGINSATAGNEFWNGNRVAASGATAGEGLFEQLIDTIGSVGQGEVDVILTSRGVRRRLADTYQSTKRFTNAQAVQIHGGYTAIFVNEVPVVADDDVPKGWAFAIRKDAFKWFQISDPDWLADPKNNQVWHLANGSVAGTRRRRLRGVVRVVCGSRVGRPEPGGRDPGRR